MVDVGDETTYLGHFGTIDRLRSIFTGDVISFDFPFSLKISITLIEKHQKDRHVIAHYNTYYVELLCITH
jgi:hypothetical protein